MQRDAAAPRRDLEARLIERTFRDAAFRRALVEDPRRTLERELGVRVPEGISLTVVEETSADRYLVLPPAPGRGGGELSDAELEAVAGGDDQGTGNCNWETANWCGF